MIPYLIVYRLLTKSDKQATQKRLELSTSAVTGRRSNQLSHWAISWTFGDSNPGPIGYEPIALTSWAKGPLYVPFRNKADDRTRTDNLLITNQLLCQLSHIGILPTTLNKYTFYSIALCANDSNGNRTRVTAVKGRCLNRLTMEPNSIYHFYQRPK